MTIAKRQETTEQNKMDHQNQEQDVVGQEENKQINGSAGKNSNNSNSTNNNSSGNSNANHANGKCTSEENIKQQPTMANGNGVHAATAQDQQQSNHNSAEDANLLPHLESIERLMKLPMVEATWHQGQDVYGKVKGNHHKLHYTYSDSTHHLLVLL